MRWTMLALSLLAVLVLLAYQTPAVRWPRAVERLDATVDDLGEAVSREDWARAGRLLDEGQALWRRSVRDLLLLNADQSEINRVTELLLRLEAAVASRDAAAAGADMASLREAWQSITDW